MSKVGIPLILKSLTYTTIDPISNADFETIFTGSFANTETQCISLSIPGDVQPGMPATLQLQFHDTNDTSSVPHYACSDLVFVPRKAMQSSTACSGPLSDEVQIALHPPPPSKTSLPSHGSLGSILALIALFLFACISYSCILPRIRQRQKETGTTVEMTRMIS